MLDANLVDHGLVDAIWAGLFTALLGGIGWILSRGFDRVEKRHVQADEQFKDHDRRITDHEYRIRAVEKDQQD